VKNRTVTDEELKALKSQHESLYQLQGGSCMQLIHYDKMWNTSLKEAQSIGVTWASEAELVKLYLNSVDNRIFRIDCAPSSGCQIQPHTTTSWIPPPRLCRPLTQSTCRPRSHPPKQATPQCTCQQQDC
jgi:hypothetical protein